MLKDFSNEHILSRSVLQLKELGKWLETNHGRQGGFNGPPFEPLNFALLLLSQLQKNLLAAKVLDSELLDQESKVDNSQAKYCIDYQIPELTMLRARFWQQLRILDESLKGSNVKSQWVWSTFANIQLLGARTESVLTTMGLLNNDEITAAIIQLEESQSRSAADLSAHLEMFEVANAFDLLSQEPVKKTIGGEELLVYGHVSDDDILKSRERSKNMKLKAEAAHDIWSHWMKYMFSQGGIFTPDGDFVINSENVARWRRQMLTAFDDLSPEEKRSDYQVAAEFLSGFGNAQTSP